MKRRPPFGLVALVRVRAGPEQLPRGLDVVPPARDVQRGVAVAVVGVGLRHVDAEADEKPDDARRLLARGQVEPRLLVAALVVEEEEDEDAKGRERDHERDPRGDPRVVELEAEEAAGPDEARRDEERNRLEQQRQDEQRAARDEDVDAVVAVERLDLQPCERLRDVQAPDGLRQERGQIEMRGDGRRLVGDHGVREFIRDALAVRHGRVVVCVEAEFEARRVFNPRDFAVARARSRGVAGGGARVCVATRAQWRSSPTLRRARMKELFFGSI
mmetsp:Transcript_10805/g.33337  ORF Transcript_10805/g.33337 Transcript_10805/m.33337 type:complete len:273 (-) Transcript_10805:122-940(-)